MQKKRIWPWVLLVVVIIIVMLAAFLVLKPRMKKVSIGTVKVQTMQNLIFASGTIKPTSRQLIYSSQLTAPVQSFSVQVGDKVHVGQVLFQLDSTSQTAAVNQAKAAVKNAQGVVVSAQAQYNAAPLAMQSQLSTQVTTAENNLANAEEQLAQAESSLDATKIRATIDGEVLIENQSGTASDGSPAPIIEVVGTGKQIVVNVSEVDAVHIHPAMTATVTSDAFPGQTWNAVVSRVADYAQENQSGAGQVEIDLNPKSTLPIPYGYQVDVHILSAIHRAVPVIPYDALVQDGDNYVVFVEKSGHVHQIPVTLGITSDTQVEVTKGLRVGDNVVLNPPTGLSDGEAVVVS